MVAFKYFNFFSDSVVAIFNFFDLSVNSFTYEVLLPIGVSFYTFQAISYIVDVYKLRAKPILSFLDFALYLSFFPQVIAGPIERVNRFYPQLKGKLMPTYEQFKEGFFLFTIGLFQKVMIGDACGRIVDTIFFDLKHYTSFEILSASLLFTFQIYADFAGYSNMARGIGLFFGVQLSQNFKQPYFSRNIQEFWRTWHISLSTWLKDYLYIPLGGSRKGKIRGFINILIVMLLGGLWHGASWNFVVWSAYHAIALVLFQVFKPKIKFNYISITLTFLFVSLGWVLFRLNSLEQFESYIIQMKSLTVGPFYLRFLKMIVSFGSVLFLIDWFQRRFNSDAFLIHFKSQSLAFGIALSLFLVCIIYISIKKPYPFIYFQF
ncbi:MBOAT family protein [Flavobacterium sp. XN-5]|uniref:MBOAT family O-acyltransferase n=1 Tax=Flavobacterium sp. XN-5 TaxID=2599390 RepID=UPI0013EF3FF8|nr:MBOAT family protein [Flavobacterium sp. XN-5]NGY36576.1 MBOAT family protein [Flavobacterium sp. XN-5]